MIYWILQLVHTIQTFVWTIMQVFGYSTALSETHALALESSDLRWHLLKFCLCGALGQLFIFKMIHSQVHVLLSIGSSFEVLKGSSQATAPDTSYFDFSGSRTTAYLVEQLHVDCHCPFFLKFKTWFVQVKLICSPDVVCCLL